MGFASWLRFSEAAVAIMALRVGALTSTGQAVSCGALALKDGGSRRRSTSGRVCVMRFGEHQQSWKQQPVQGLGHWGAPIVKKSVRYGRRVPGNASAELASGGGDDGGNGLKGYGGGDGESEDEGKGGAKNREEALMALSGLGKTLENLPADLASALQEGRITGAIVKKYFELQDSKFLGWLLSFAGFKERLLADDLFMTKVGIECGVGIFTKVSFAPPACDSMFTSLLPSLGLLHRLVKIELGFFPRMELIIVRLDHSMLQVTELWS